MRRVNKKYRSLPSGVYGFLTLWTRSFASVGLDREAGRGGGGIIIGGPGFARVDGLLAVGVTRALEERLVLFLGMLTNEVVDNTIIIVKIIIML